MGSPGASLSVAEPYDSYEWLPTSQNSQSALLTLGTYELVVTHYTGCTDTIDIEIDQVSNPPQPQLTVSGPLEFCAGGSVTLSGPEGYAGYTWNSGSVGRDITVYESGTFVLSVTDFIGCSSSSNSLQVIVNPDPIAQFSPDLDGFGISFNNLSTDASDYFWNFGDGNTSTDFEPNYSYSDTGSVNMYLVASNNCSSDTAFLTLNSVDVQELDNQRALKVYPNPVSDRLFVEFSSPVVSCKILSVSGADIALNEEMVHAHSTVASIDVSHLKNGHYFLSAVTEDGSLFFQRFLKR